ncbi:MAG: sensor histidine kinase [Candidatus Tisiphia sp.]
MDYSQEIIVDFIDYYPSLMDSTNTVLVPKISKKFNPRKLVNRIITKLIPTASFIGIKLVNNFYRDITPIITGDSYRIEAILMQLVSNAISFTKEGNVILTSHFFAPSTLESPNDDIEDTKEAILQFIVHDTGIGMSKEKEQYLYEQLNSLDNSTSQATREELQSKTNSESIFELGLGLSLVKQFIGELKGKIDVSSYEDKGTTFTVQVPVK